MIASVVVCGGVGGDPPGGWGWGGGEAALGKRAAPACVRQAFSRQVREGCGRENQRVEMLQAGSEACWSVPPCSLGGGVPCPVPGLFAQPPDAFLDYQVRVTAMDSWSPT